MATTELLKKVLYTGVGVVSTTTDRVKQSIDELTQVGEEAQEEGKKKVDVFTDEMNTRREDISARFKSIIDTVLGQFDLPNRTEAESLNAKIAELEEKLAATQKEARKTVRKTAAKAKPVAKKVVAKKAAAKTTAKKVVAKAKPVAKKVAANTEAATKKTAADVKEIIKK